MGAVWAHFWCTVGATCLRIWAVFALGQFLRNFRRTFLIFSALWVIFGALWVRLGHFGFSLGAVGCTSVQQFKSLCPQTTQTLDTAAAILQAQGLPDFRWNPELCLLKSMRKRQHEHMFHVHNATFQKLWEAKSTEAQVDLHSAGGLSREIFSCPLKRRARNTCQTLTSRSPSADACV